MQYYDAGGLSDQDILEIINKNEEISFKTYSLWQKEDFFLGNVLNIFLKKIGYDYIYDYIHYCFKELISNAKRANIKRAYFIEKKLDINDATEYENGMTRFKNELQEKGDYYSNVLFDKDFYILIHLKFENENFNIQIINNSIILDREHEAIISSISRAKHFNSFDEALSLVTMETEGAGLGIIIIILMLKKLGLGKEYLSVEKGKHETKVNLNIPLSLINIEQKLIISNMIINEINELPKFPEHILALQKKIDNPDITINEIVREIANDPSLVADILKAANSPLYMFPGQISSIVQAVKLIGLRELKNIFYTYGTYHILSKRYDVNKMKTIWDHSHKVAFFSMLLARNYLKKEFIEDSYVGGLLHDIGKILLLGINSKLLMRIKEICVKKNIPVRILEDITSGYNHALIGSMIAEKWNFPKKYIEILKFHNRPMNYDSNENRDLIFCIYFANILNHEENVQSIFNQINKTILSFFKIDSVEQFKAMISKYNEKFKDYENESFF